MAESKLEYARRLTDSRHPDAHKPEHEIESAGESSEDAKSIRIECIEGDHGTGAGYKVSIELDHDHKGKEMDYAAREKCCHREALFAGSSQAENESRTLEFVKKYL